jgi:hypothetical protein
LETKVTGSGEMESNSKRDQGSSGSVAHIEEEEEEDEQEQEEYTKIKILQMKTVVLNDMHTFSEQVFLKLAKFIYSLM